MAFMYSSAHICAQVDMPAQKYGSRCTYTQTHTPQELRGGGDVSLDAPRQVGYGARGCSVEVGTGAWVHSEGVGVGWGGIRVVRIPHSLGRLTTRAVWRQDGTGRVVGTSLAGEVPDMRPRVGGLRQDEAGCA